MNDEQKRLLDLLTRCAKFMHDNDITFYLYGGTAIGALRHNGFIPWDDDLDIVVTRTDFEKIIKCMDKMPWDDIEFMSIETNPHYFKPSGFFAMKDNLCTSISRMFYRGPCMGTVCDIFIMDDFKSEDMEEMKKNLILYDDVLVDAWLYNVRINEFDEDYFKCKAEQAQVGKMPVVDRLKANLEYCPPEEGDMYMTRWSKTTIMTYPKEQFGEPIYVDFEGVPMPVPAKPEKMIRVEYGYDWYMVPEHDNQEQHGFIINPNLSANNIAEDLKHFVDWDRADRDLRNRKMETVKGLRSRLPKEDTERKIFARVIEHRVKSGVNEIIADDSMSPRAVIERLEPVVEYSGLFKFEDAKEPIATKAMQKMMKALILAGRYFDADRLRKHFQYALEDEAGLEIADLLEKVIEVAIAYQDHESLDLRMTIDAIPEELRYTISDCITGEIRMVLAGESDKFSKDQLLELCDKNLEIFYDNYDVMKAKADILWSEDRKDEAEKLYRTVYDKSRNGLDLIDITKRLNIPKWDKYR